MKTTQEIREAIEFLENKGIDLEKVKIEEEFTSYKVKQEFFSIEDRIYLDSTDVENQDRIVRFYLDGEEIKDKEILEKLEFIYYSI